MKDAGGREIRRRNLARVLGLLHLDGPRSRAELTHSTGLNRSTVGDLVTALTGAGFAVENAPDRSRRVGRPSPVVSVAPDVLAIAVNPEVDAVTIAAVGLNQRIAARERIEVDALVTPEETADLTADLIARWRSGLLRDAKIVAVGVAVPGLVRAADGRVREAPHLGWQEVPLRELMSERTGLPTAVDNDATLGVIAEHLFGAARGLDQVTYLNGGASGIGGGLIVHGMPVRGVSGYAGEFGHNRPGIAAAIDRRAQEGVLEDEVSRARLLHALSLRSADEPTLAAALASTKDPGALAEIARQRGILATALANAVNVLNPEAVVLGGFLAALAATDLAELRTLVRSQSMPAPAEDVEIRLAVLAEDRLLIGAAEAAFVPLLSDPASLDAAHGIESAPGPSGRSALTAPSS